MSELCPLAPQPILANQPPAPTPSEPIWPQLPAERRAQALLILAQMLLSAQGEEAGHDQPE